MTFTSSVGTSLGMRAAPPSRPDIDSLVQQAASIRNTDIEHSLALAQQALALANQIQPPYPQGRIASLLEVVISNSMLGRLEVALTDALTGLEWCTGPDCSMYRARFLDRLGIICQQIGDYANALQYQLEALKLHESGSSQEALATSCFAIGMTYSMTGRAQDARPWYQKSLDIFQALGHIRGQADVLNNLSVDARYAGEFEQAIAYGFASLKHSEATGDMMARGTAMGSIGEAYMEAGQYDEAMDYCAGGLELVRTASGGIQGPAAVELLLDIGRIDLQRNRLENAISTLVLAAEVSADSGFNHYLYLCHEALAQAYERSGDLRQALEHHKQFGRIKELVTNEKSVRAIKQTELLYNLQKVKAEIDHERLMREQDRQHFEQLTHLKNEFISTASHDMRNPITSVMTAVYLLRRHGRLDDVKGQAYLQRIENDALHIRDLVNDVFDLARLETQHSFHKELVPLTAFVQDIVTVFRPIAEAKSISVSFESSLADLSLEMDPVQMRRALDNLLSNAIKYTPANGRIEVHLSPSTASDQILLTVSDTGIGIPPADLPHIFTHFYRVKDDSHLAVEGTGLGLSICKAVIEQHGGQIAVESQPGQGTRFSITFSYHPPSAAPAEADSFR